MSKNDDDALHDSARSSRRRFLGAGATVAALGLAGCSDLVGDGGDGEGSGTATATEVPALSSISYGTTAQGTLAADAGSDPATDGIATPVSFEGNEGDLVAATMLSTEFSAHVSLTDPNGSVIADSASGKSLEAGLSTDGEYTLWAGSQAGDETGPYTLSLEKTGQDLVAIEYGETAEGTLREGEGEVPEIGSLGDAVAFEGSESDIVSITLESEEFRPRLVLTGPTGSVVGTSDYGGSGANTTLETGLSDDGEYTVWVTSFEGDATGSYTLSLEKTGEIEPAPQDLRSISYGETARGTVDSEDPNVATTEYVGEPVAFEGSSGDEIAATVESRAFTGLLVLADADGEILGSAAARSDEPARLETSLSADAEFTLWVTSSRGEGQGPYTLSLEKTGEVEPAQQDLRSISYGESARGTIDRSDGTAPQQNQPGEPVTFSGSGGDAVTVSMTSEEVDPYLVLVNPDSNVVAENDDSGAGLNSELTYTLDSDGEYTIWATTFGGGTGAYTLSLSLN